MTSQEHNEIRQDLLERAKEIGFAPKGIHLYGVDKLERAVREAERAWRESESAVADGVVPDVAEPERKEEALPARKAAPRMSVSGLRGDTRAKVIADLEAANPGWKYVYQPSKAEPAELARKGLESTGKYHKSDLICRTDKAAYEEWLEERNIVERETMDSIDMDGTRILSQTASPKTPVEGRKHKQS